MGRVLTRADEEALREIKRIVLEEAERLGIRVEKVILFGSRARGEAREDSDWDILVIVSDRASDKSLKMLRRSLYIKLDLPVDIITIRWSRWVRHRYMPGTIAYEASREGIAIA